MTAIQKILHLMRQEPAIQDAKGRAKPYQVRQVLKAIDKLESMQ